MIEGAPKKEILNEAKEILKDHLKSVRAISG